MVAVENGLYYCPYLYMSLVEQQYGRNMPNSKVIFYEDNSCDNRSIERHPRKDVGCTSYAVRDAWTSDPPRFHQGFFCFNVLFVEVMIIV